MSKDLEKLKEQLILKIFENVYALKNIKDQTPELCLAAVKANREALQYVKEQNENMD